MRRKRITVRNSRGSKSFTWWERSGDLCDDSGPKVGSARKLEDAIALAKAHVGGSNLRVEIKDT